MEGFAQKPHGFSRGGVFTRVVEHTARVGPDRGGLAMPSQRDVTGHWEGSYHQHGRPHPISAELVQEGEHLAGSMRDGEPDQEMSVVVSVGVSYDSDLDYVERVTVEVGREVMREVDGAVPEHEPLVRYTSFGDSSVKFNVILRTSEANERGTVTHEFIKRLHRRFQAEGIDIPFPTITLTRVDAPSPSSELVPARTQEHGLD